jgi:hypothetical protein
VSGRLALTPIDRKASGMKLRSLLTLVVGIGIGLAIARKLRGDDPDVVQGPQRTRSSGRFATVQDQGRNLADQASVLSLDMIRRTRGMIRERLAEYKGADDDTAWN